MAWILSLWLVWILGNLALMAFVRPPDAPCFNGFRVHVPRSYLDRLTVGEWLGIYLHECGHRARGHVWKNFILVCLFTCASPARRTQQEFEADDYAAARGYGRDLASALRKLGARPASAARAERLELREEIFRLVGK